MSRNEKGQFAAGAPSERRREWVGERFGKLVVTHAEYGVKRGKKTRTICTCQCDCGNIIETVAEYLTAGKTSCGCDTHERRVNSQRIDLTGRKFGRLTVEEMIWDTKPTRCVCVCDCGNKTTVINTQLINGKTASCGCIQRERTSAANTKDFSGYTTDSGVQIVERVKQNAHGVWEYNCICPFCGNTFVALPAKLIYNDQLSCGCVIRSKGEETVRRALDALCVRYATQYTIPECKYKKSLRFDFAIFDQNDELIHLIEYDGMQHTAPIEFFGGDSGFNERRQRDSIKDEFCKQNKIPLTRMPYTMSPDEITNVIKNIINP